MSSQYVAPASLQFVSDLLAFREEKSIIDLMDEKSNSFDNPGASHHQVQVEYIKGLSAIGVCLISFWFLWLLVLAFLKCGGKRIGCASGQPFRSWDRDVQGDHNNIENDGVHQSTSNNTGSRPRVDYLEGLWRYENEQPSFQDIWDEPDDGYEDDLYTTISAGVSTKSSLTHRLRSCCCSDSREQVERRKRRTRWVYFAAFVVVEVTGILLFFYFCYPLVDATTNAGLIIVEGQAIHTEIDQSLTQIRTSLTLVGRLLRNNIPLDNSLQSICPNVDAESEVAALLGNDFQTVLGFLATDYPDVLDSVESDLDVGSSFADALGEALSRSVVVLNETEEKLWILPFLVLSSMIVNWIFGMFFAATVWDGSSSSSSRKDDFRWKYKKAFLLNRILLPIAVVLSSLLFFLSVSMLMGGALASDSCIAGEDRSPDATVEAIIRRQQVSRQMDEFSALTVKAYTVDGCQGDDPVEGVLELLQLLEGATGLMHQWIEQAYLGGFTNFANSSCGEGNRVLEFFDGVFLMHAQLWNIQELLRNLLDDTLSCERVHGLYVAMIHDLGCTDLSAAAASGFLLTLLHATAGLILVSLRASWKG